MEIEANIQVWVGPRRGEAAFPVIEEGADFAPGGGWSEVTGLLREVACAFDGHEHALTLTLAEWALDTDTFADDRQVICRARWRDDQAGWSPWQVVFAGYCTGEAAGRSEGSAWGPEREGTVVCRQEWAYLERLQLPALQFGRVNLARNRPATASSTLASIAAEAGIEYLTATSVGPEQAVDGNRDTLWVSATLADPAPAPLLATGQQLIFQELYNGRGNLGYLGANGRPLWIELWCADVRHTASFESGLNGWVATQGASISSSTAWAAPGAGSRSLLISAPAAGGGAQVDVAGLAPEVEVAATFVLRSNTGADLAIDALLAGQGSTLVQRLVAPAASSGRRYTLRHPASRNGTVNLRFKAVAAGVSYFVDDVRISGGVRLSEDGQPYKRLWLVWEDGQGNAGFADVPSALGIAAVGGDRSVILVDDADLFRAMFDAGDATVVQYRAVAALAGLDFAAGRGRLRLAYYRRWPDLPGSGAAIWDDAPFNTLPDFTATQSLVRTQVTPAAYQPRDNPAPGGAEATGPAWLRVDLGSFAPATLQAGITASATAITLDSTAAYPQYGLAWLDNERVWCTRTGPATMTIARGQGGTTAASHPAGTGLYPEVDGAKVTLPLVAAVGVRRRPGTPRLIDFDIIGSVLANPGDPATPDSSGRTWGAHQDWFPLVTVRGNRAAAPTYLLRREGDWQEVSWPPPIGWSANWGRPVRWLLLVIHRMEPWQGAAQRAKVNELVAYAADLASSGAGEWAGASPPDLRGVIGHVLAQHAGLPLPRIRIDRGTSDGIAWGAGYGELRTAPGTAAALLADLEERGLLRVVCTAGNLVRVLPDPLTTSAAWQPPARTWDAAAIWRIAPARRPAHAVAQVRVTARNDATGEVFSAAYPRTPAPLGALVDLSDAIAGDQAAADERARRGYVQGNARWEGVIDGGPMPPPRPWQRHLVNEPGGDRAGVELGNRSMVVTGWNWRCALDGGGADWRTSVSLIELAG